MKELIDRRKDLKRKLANRARVFAGWTSLGQASISEIFACSGVDYVGIDMEHSPISQQQAQSIIAACQAGGILCLPRIASHNGEMARRLLDSGADGLIVPMVNSPRDIEKVISWMKYPPVGQRGFGVARAQGYGMRFQEYIESWNTSSVFIAQIETIQAVENIEAIVSCDDLDGVMVGPYDISGSLDRPGQLTHPDVVQAGQRVVAACQKQNKACGTQIVDPSQENITEAFEQGYSFVVLASDIFILWKWAQRMRGYIQTARKP